VVKREKQRGFTLVEVLVAIVLCAVAMVGVIALYRASTNASSFSRHTTEATVLAQAKLEQLRTQTGLVALTSEGPLDEMGKTGTGGIFTRDWTVSLTGTNTYHDVVVNVSWVDEGVARSVTLRGRRNIP
jgi:type II secretion system protein I